VRCYLYPKRFPVRVKSSDIVLDTPDFVVLDKPGGLPSVAGSDNGVENATYLTSQHLNTPLWPVHRLDTPTTGLLILAKSSAACSSLGKSWSNGSVNKYYSVLAHANEKNPTPLPEPGTTVTHWMNFHDSEMPRPIQDDQDEAKGFDKHVALVLQDWKPIEPAETGEPMALCQVKLLVSYKGHMNKNSAFKDAQVGITAHVNRLLRDGAGERTRRDSIGKLTTAM